MILKGIKVVDWTMFQVGPFAAAILADLGADVVHVEQKGVGDLLRSNVSSWGLPRILPGGRHIAFEEHNRNKRGIALDLKKPQGREIMYQLVREADVFVANFLPSTIRKLGMDYETLRGVNPRLIYASASGYGKKGPDSQLPCVDSLVQGRSGAMLASGEADTPPCLMTIGIVDRATGIYLALGILAALIARDREGISQEVYTSMLGSMIALQGWSFMPVFAFKREYPRHRRDRPVNPMSNWYRCQDGRWVIVGTVRNERDWRIFCEALGAPELLDDPRFDTNSRREENSAELVKVLDRIFATRTAEEWQRRMREKGMLFTIINSPLDLVNDPQVVENNYIINWQHPDVGVLPFVNFPVEFSETPVSVTSPAPTLGQHTEEVLLELGYNWSDIEALNRDEVI